MGQYHGKWGFQTFSHARALQKKTTLFDLPFRYPPYTAQNQKMTRRFMG
jgi:aldehyde dehydrogenase (NAD+)